MSATFAELAEDIRHRSSEEKQPLLSLLEREIIEARREEFARHSAEALEEHALGRLPFSADPNVLKRTLESAWSISGLLRLRLQSCALLARGPRFEDSRSMKAAVLLGLALAGSVSLHAQYSARQLTRKVVPPAQAPPPPPAYRPSAPAAAAPAAPALPASPAEQAKAQATKSKNDVKQFEFYKKRAEEGSDHAQYELGLRYLTGKGTAADEKLGREWLGKAAKLGHKQAGQKLAELGDAPATAATTAAAAVSAPAKAAPAQPAAK